MQTLVYTGPRQLELQQHPSPSPGPDEVLIRVAFAGICGSELGGYLGHNALRIPPLVMGHEFAGEIAAVGVDANVRNPDLAQGQWVTANPLADCGSCEFCRGGMNQLCTTRQLIGAHRPGAYAEYVSVPAKQVIPLPSGMSLRTGALTEPAACGVRIGELAGPLEGRAALVIGAGPIGLLGLQALRSKGASPVFIADVDPARLAMGRALGGEPIDPNSVDLVRAVRDATDGYGVPVSVDAVGTVVTRAQCVGATRSAGTVILVGLHEETGPMPAAEIVRREIVVRGSFGYTPGNFAEALLRLADNTMGLEPWIVEAPLAAGGEWFERLVNAPGDVSKVLLVPGATSEGRVAC